MTTNCYSSLFDTHCLFRLRIVKSAFWLFFDTRSFSVVSVCLRYLAIDHVHVDIVEAARRLDERRNRAVYVRVCDVTDHVGQAAGFISRGTDRPTDVECRVAGCLVLPSAIDARCFQPIRGGTFTWNAPSIYCAEPNCVFWIFAFTTAACMPTLCSAVMLCTRLGERLCPKCMLWRSRRNCCKQYNRLLASSSVCLRRCALWPIKRYILQHKCPNKWIGSAVSRITTFNPNTDSYPQTWLFSNHRCWYHLTNKLKHCEQANNQDFHVWNIYRQLSMVHDYSRQRRIYDVSTRKLNSDAFAQFNAFQRGIMMKCPRFVYSLQTFCYTT